jgi:hypothetical protein
MTAPKMQLPYYSFVKRGGNLCYINPLKEFQKTRSRDMTAEYREDKLGYNCNEKQLHPLKLLCRQKQNVNKHKLHNDWAVHHCLLFFSTVSAVSVCIEEETAQDTLKKSSSVCCAVNRSLMVLVESGYLVTMSLGTFDA